VPRRELGRVNMRGGRVRLLLRWCWMGDLPVLLRVGCILTIASRRSSQKVGSGYLTHSLPWTLFFFLSSFFAIISLIVFAALSSLCMLFLQFRIFPMDSLRSMPDSCNFVQVQITLFVLRNASICMLCNIIFICR